MPVQFICPKCQKLLSVGSRKVGCQVNCPKCASEVVVPAAEDAGVPMARAARERLSVLEAPITELLVDEPADTIGDDLPLVAPVALESSRHTPCAVTGNGTRSVPATNGMARRGPTPVATAVATPAIATAAAGEPPVLPAVTVLPSFDVPQAMLPPLRSAARREMIMISRTTLYVQAILLCLVAGVAFVVGYAVGCDRPPVSAVQSEPSNPVVLDGKLGDR
jgi:hypothetical protein